MAQEKDVYSVSQWNAYAYKDFQSDFDWEQNIRTLDSSIRAILLDYRSYYMMNLIALKQYHTIMPQKETLEDEHKAEMYAIQRFEDKYGSLNKVMKETEK